MCMKVCISKSLFFFTSTFGCDIANTTMVFLLMLTVGMLNIYILLYLQIFQARPICQLEIQPRVEGSFKQTCERTKYAQESVDPS